MKEVHQVVANYMLAVEGKTLVPTIEVGIVVSEPHYAADAADAAGDLVRSRVTETMRFAGTPGVLRQVADSLRLYADEADEMLTKKGKAASSPADPGAVKRDGLAAALAALERDCPPLASRWRHVKSGGEYAVVGGVVIEDTLTPAVAYRNEESGQRATWVRPLAEFLDGRFERVRA